MKNILGICFLILFLPYVITLLISGRQGVGRQEKLPEREYEVLEMMLSEDLSWMDASTLRLLAVLKRTEVVRQQESGVSIVQDLRNCTEIFTAGCMRLWKRQKDRLLPLTENSGNFLIMASAAGIPGMENFWEKNMFT